MYTVVTHDGGFHADDVFGVAALQLKFGVDAITVIRTRDQATIDAAVVLLKQYTNDLRRSNSLQYRDREANLLLRQLIEKTTYSVYLLKHENCQRM